MTGKRFLCSGCNATADSPNQNLPEGWHWQTTPRLGDIPRCPDCAVKNATRIATGRMSTEDILNAGKDGEAVDSVTGAAQTRLRSFFQRFNALMDDMDALRVDLKEVGAEAKGEGFDIKVLMKVVRESRKDKIKRQEEQAIFDLYASALGEDL